MDFTSPRAGSPVEQCTPITGSLSHVSHPGIHAIAVMAVRSLPLGDNSPVPCQLLPHNVRPPHAGAAWGKPPVPIPKQVRAEPSPAAYLSLTNYMTCVTSCNTCHRNDNRLSPFTSEMSIGNCSIRSISRFNKSCKTFANLQRMDRT